MSDEISEHVVRLREGAAGWRQVDGPRLDEDDPFLTGLDEEEAEALVRSNWALQRSSAEEAQEFYGPPDKEEDEEEVDESADEESAEESQEEQESEEAANEAVIETWESWNEEDWLDLDYQQRAEDVREGRVDDHLHEIADVETSQTVEDAVSDRLAEVTDEVQGAQPDEEA